MKNELNNYCEILSVKRKSDGEIFSVGDKLALWGNPKIFKIEISKYGNHCWLHYLSIAQPNEDPIKAKRGGINYTDS